MSPDSMAMIREGLILYIILAASIALHEFGHAKAADLLGDFLPRSQGRVTLNPLVHLDPIGTGLIPLSMILFRLPFSLIGWGRPVQISLPHPKTRVRDEILITLAGPLMNVLIATVVAVGYGLLAHISPEQANHFEPLADAAIAVNCTLIAFNLIPLPPLDGSRIMRHVVGMSEEMFVRLSMNSWWILLILINLRPVQVFVGHLAYEVSIPFMSLGSFLAR